MLNTSIKNMLIEITYPDHFFSSCFGSKHAKNACATAHIQHHFVLEQMFVVEHGIAVGESADFIF